LGTRESRRSAGPREPPDVGDPSAGDQADAREVAHGGEALQPAVGEASGLLGVLHVQVRVESLPSTIANA
jgi:hypothetical protein